MPTVPGGLFDDPTLSAGQSALISQFLDLLTIRETELTVFNLRGQSSFTLDADTNNVAIFNGADESVITSLEPSDGTSLIMGGAGQIVINGNSGNDRVLGGPGADTINGGTGDNRLAGGDGADSVVGLTGADVLYGNSGADTLSSNQGSDTLFGGSGNDVILGQDDADVMFGNRDQDIIYGVNGADLLYGNQDDDVLYGGADADTIFGGQGDDNIYGGMANDVFFGNRGDDTFFILSGEGNDRVFGFQLGDDVVAIETNINGLVVATEADLTGRISDDLDGNAVIDLDLGNQLTLVGFSTTDLLANLDIAVDIV